jgi:hypothetical protein
VWYYTVQPYLELAVVGGGADLLAAVQVRGLHERLGGQLQLLLLPEPSILS